jgi:acetyl-CoA acetyltransferase
VNGGAIAFGHPLDESTPVMCMQFFDLRFDFLVRCTGVRQVVTGLNELRRRQEKVMCH